MQSTSALDFAKHHNTTLANSMQIAINFGILKFLCNYFKEKDILTTIFT